MQRVVNLIVQQGGQSFAAADGKRLGGQVLQNLLRVVGAAEEGAVQPRAHAAMHLGCARDQQHAEGRAHGNGGFRSGGEMAGEYLRQPEGRAHRNRQDQEDESALHHEVARAALQQHGNIHHPVLHHGVGEGEGKQEQENYLDEIQPKGKPDMENFLRERDDHSGRDCRRWSPRKSL